MYAEGIAKYTTKKETAVLFQVLVLSAALHLIVGYLLFQSHSTSKKARSEQIQIKPIQAKLIFVPIQPQEPVLPVEMELEAQPVEIMPEAEELSEDKVSNKMEVENTDPIIPQLSAPEMDTRRTDLPQISSPDLAKHHLKEFNRNANNALAQREAQRYRQQRNSPNIDLPKSDPFLTADEKFRKERTVRVNCSSGLNKSLAIVSSITGGNLDCSETQSITPYIDKHLKKGLTPIEN